ncbi:hypothetical protein DSM101010T_14240 [Desulfovibrio subterraneus]|uniref:Uncharacterized protein n=1 Tax=Desulfovibrio subterraneus TaxID=2718620 RepID=A0A7J0BH59_9BACT|nr:hypothetical protein DSM101010T_14240 [Desulfovibrio subterraneus]
MAGGEGGFNGYDEPLARKGGVNKGSKEHGGKPEKQIKPS